MSLNIHQISRRCSRRQRENAAFVRILKTQKGYTASGKGYVACQSYSTHVLNEYGRPVRNESPHKYVTMMIFLDTNLNVKISCSCPDFLYRWEWALHNRGAADIEYSNGDFPDITNPKYKPACCKHLYKLYLNIKPHLPNETAPSKTFPTKPKRSTT